MKKHLSVFTLIAHHSIYKVLILLLVMACVEAGPALSFFQKNPETFFTTVLELIRLPWIFAAAFLLLTLLLCRNSKTFIGSSNYTVQRLAVSETAFYFWQSFFHTLCYLMLWAVQLAVVLLLGQYYYTQIDVDPLNHQAMFLLFYAEEFFHGLLPLEESIAWYANLALLAGLGLTTAYFPFKVRQHQFPVAIAFMLSMTLLWFSRETGSFLTNACIILFTIIEILITLYQLFFSRKEE